MDSKSGATAMLFDGAVGYPAGYIKMFELMKCVKIYDNKIEWARDSDTHLPSQGRDTIMSPFKMMSTKAGYRGQEFGNQLGAPKCLLLTMRKCKEVYSPH